MDDDSGTEILEAIYRALCGHGYAARTTSDIDAGTADEPAEAIQS